MLLIFAMVVPPLQVQEEFRTENYEDFKQLIRKIEFLYKKLDIFDCSFIII